MNLRFKSEASWQNCFAWATLIGGVLFILVEGWLRGRTVTNDISWSVAAVVGAGTSDSRFFRARGIVAYGIAPFKVNYYDADTVHASDERIRARFFTQGTRLVRRIVRDFCAREQ